MSTALVPQNGESKPAVAPPAQQMPQYAQGFEGAASGAFPKEAADLLAAPVKPEEVETKPNGIVYLPGVWYRRQLTRAFGAGAWALLPRGPARTMGEIVIYHGALYILGRFVSEAVGECETRFGMSYASSLEGARTDALTRCCKDLGMATELWDPEWRGAWQAKWCSKTWEEAKGNKKAGYVFKKLDKPNRAPDPVSGRNVGPISAALESGMAKMATEIHATGGQAAPTTDLASPRHAASESGSAVSSPVVPEQSGQTPSGQGVNPGAGGQAATTPKGQPGNGPGSTVDASSSSDGAPSTADTGEAATDGELEMLRTQVGKLKWAKPKARSWLKATFGESETKALTKQQAASALALLLAAGQGDDDTAYALVYDRLKAEGKVL